LETSRYGGKGPLGGDNRHIQQDDRIPSGFSAFMPLESRRCCFNNFTIQPWSGNKKISPRKLKEWLVMLFLRLKSVSSNLQFLPFEKVLPELQKKEFLKKQHLRALICPGTEVALWEGEYYFRLCLTVKGTQTFN
jgi:hypothetical protein